MTRKLTRLDQDIYDTLREQAHRSNEPMTLIVNRLLRYALPLAEAGVFNLPHETILAALDLYGEQLLARADALAAEQLARAAATAAELPPQPPATGRRRLANPQKPL